MKKFITSLHLFSIGDYCPFRRSVLVPGVRLWTDRGAPEEVYVPFYLWGTKESVPDLRPRVLPRTVSFPIPLRHHLDPPASGFKDQRQPKGLPSRSTSCDKNSNERESCLQVPVLLHKENTTEKTKSHVFKFSK